MFRESLVLRSEWDAAYVRKQVRRNLEVDGRPFLVSSGEENQKAIVDAVLDAERVPHWFFRRGEPHLWQCLVRELDPDNGLACIESDDAPPETIKVPR
jgi:hypothetical protein